MAARAPTTSSNTLSTSYLPNSPTSLQPDPPWREQPHKGTNIVINISSNNDSTGKGILIGMLSAFGSAAFVVLIFAIFYFFRYTSRGRIFLDRIGRPGEYDDEQALAREEAEALEDMDDLQRVEYMRAKGTDEAGFHADEGVMADRPGRISLHPSQPTRNDANRHIIIAILGNTREGRVRMGVRAGARDSKLFRRRTDGDRVFRFRMQRSEQPTHSEAERGILLGSQALRQAGLDPDQYWRHNQTVSPLQTTW